jgi:hypothetical protein
MTNRNDSLTTLHDLRTAFHGRLFDDCVRFRSAGVPSMADKDSPSSVKLAMGMVTKIGFAVPDGTVSAQAVGSSFARVVCDFLQLGFGRLKHLRPGDWTFSTAQGPHGIAKFSQYAHLASIERVLNEHPQLRSSLGGDYLIKPDIVVSRKPVDDLEINREQSLVDAQSELARKTPLRAGNIEGSPDILHATVSVKWSMRSDRAQNTRTEALNVIRNRKGGSPRIVVVTMEPLPSRLASIAMGTGDIDCCYHAALGELMHAATSLDQSGSEAEILRMLVEGQRLRDISDLPFDLAI